MSFKYRDENRSLDLYLKEIGETPLLTRDDEVRLARLIKGSGSKSKKALKKLTSANLRFVVSVAKQYQNQGLPLADLINEGNIGLMKAAKRFDETRGFKFISYAVWWIRQAILLALAEQSRIMRLPLNRAETLYKIGKISAKLEQEFGRKPSDKDIADKLGITLEEVSEAQRILSSHLSLDAPTKEGEDTSLLNVLEDKHQPSPDEQLLQELLRSDIEAALDSLTAREAEVINLYFGLNGERAITLKEIGTRFFITGERIRSIKEEAINKLRHASRSRALRTYLTLNAYNH